MGVDMAVTSMRESWNQVLSPSKVQLCKGTVTRMLQSNLAVIKKITFNQ
jgi:hypothetical protein